MLRQHRQQQQGTVVLPPVNADDSINQNAAETSAVVRARYEPDVRGVNRYKHFYNPISSNNGGGGGGESIDKKSPRSPRSSPRPRTTSKVFRDVATADGKTNQRSNDLPQINDSSQSGSNSPPQNYRDLCTSRFRIYEKVGRPYRRAQKREKSHLFRPNVWEGFVQQQIRTLSSSNSAQNIKLQSPPAVDTWRVRRRPPPLKGSECNSRVQNGIIVMETLLDLKQPQQAADSQPSEKSVAPCKDKSLTSKSGASTTALPEIIMPPTKTRNNNSPPSKSSDTQQQRNKSEGKKSNSAGETQKPNLLVISQASKILDSMPSPTTTITPEVTIITMQSRNGEVPRPTKKSTGTTIKQPRNVTNVNSDPINNNIDNINKGVRNVSDYVRKIDTNAGETDGKPKALYKQYRMKKTMIETETQSETQTQANETTSKNVACGDAKESDNIVEKNDQPSHSHIHNLTDRRTPKATQTENVALFSNNMNIIYAENTVELEQRTELLEIIDIALSETIDRQSRQLANQFIASTARKQAQVWRDSKEFVSTILVPYSIALANRARSARLSYEKIANIQLP